MKKVYESPQSTIVVLEYTHQILYVSQEPVPTPSGEGVIDEARPYNWFDLWEEDDEE